MPDFLAHSAGAVTEFQRLLLPLASSLSSCLHGCVLSDAGFDWEPVKTDDGGYEVLAAGLGAGENHGLVQVRTLAWCR